MTAKLNRKSVDLLKLLRGEIGSSAGSPDSRPGLKIIKVETTDPNPITFTFEGRKTAVDLDIFEIPVSCYPLRKGDRLLVFPMAVGDRWGVVNKLDDGLVMGSLLGSSSLQPDGMEAPYGAADLIFPEDVIFQAGDRAAIFPTLWGGVIKYVVIKT